MNRYGWLVWRCALCNVEGEAPDHETACRVLRVHYVSRHMPAGGTGATVHATTNRAQGVAR